MDNTEPKWKQILHVTSNAATVNFLFLLCCIPIVTIGQAWCGLYSAIRYAIRGDGWFSGFKAGIKTRFLRGVIAWTVCMAVDLYMAANVITMAYYKVDGYIVPLVMSCVFLLIALMFCFVARIDCDRRLIVFVCLVGGLSISVLQLLGSRLLGGATSNPLLAPFSVFIGMLIWFSFIAQILMYCATFIGQAQAMLDEWGEGERALKSIESKMTGARR